MKKALLLGVLAIALSAGAYAQPFNPRTTVQSGVLASPHVSLAPRTRLMCFWRENNNASFGTSGFCPVNDPHAYVGVGCVCSHTEEHRLIEHWGVVMEAPVGDGSVQQVH